MINNTLYYRFIECDSNKEWFNRRRKINPQDVEACAGILKDGLIMIDTDTDRDSELLLLLLDKLKCKCNIVSTIHGIHAIFKKPKDYHVKSDSKYETVTGLIVDVKQGRKIVQNSDIDIVKRYGQEMETIQYCPIDELDELPWQLRVFNDRLNLQQARDNSGRHSLHQRLIARWQEYTNSNAVEVLKWVQWVNDYVFAVPRKSVNWTVKQVQEWYDEHPLAGYLKDKTIDDIITLIDGQDLNAIYRMVVANIDRT